MAAAIAFKVDVDTHDGMRDGVPRLLDLFREMGVRATFFLSFGPDNSGKAIWNVFTRKGFLKKMLKTGAPKLYGYRTMLSGTLLPARPIATKFPEICRRIEAEGHEVGVHAWDHRLWQDHLDRLSKEEIEEQTGSSFAAFSEIFGRPARSAAAPAWYQTPASLKVQDSRGLLYASDIRGGFPFYPILDGYRSSTLQIPTTRPCLEELMTLGEEEPMACVSEVLGEDSDEPEVVPLHAEVEGGPYVPFLREMLDRMKASGTPVVTLEERAKELLAASPPPPAAPAALEPIPGRSGRVFVRAAGR